MFINLILVFLTIYVANKTREIEKSNNHLNLDISKISEDIKINKIELITHKNSTYLKKLHKLYFTEFKKKNPSNLISIKKNLLQDENYRLVNINN